MCGITGLFSFNGFNEEFLRKMTEVISHRGPDDTGIKIFKEKKYVAGFGQKRLSILDLSESGHQPMANADGSIWITFNGEIYNYTELREQLKSCGYGFKSQTDTEVIIYGYQEFGTEFFSKMNGMFAFCLFDKRKSEFILVRDRLGQKPLHYYFSNKNFAFSSELKSLTTLPFISKNIDFKNLSRYFAFEYLPSPFTIYENIYKLKPGHFLKIKVQNSLLSLSEKKYWDIDFQKIEVGSNQKEIENNIIRLLKDSIVKRLMSDVPLGVFLSGGIDSAAIVALLSEIMNPREIKTFTIGFEEKTFDETNYASKISKIFKTDHHEQILSLDKMLRIIPEIFEKLDEPFADASIIPTYLLSKFTRNYVTVALGGDGGDELFAGYDPFLAAYWTKYYEKIPYHFHKKIVKPLIGKLPVSAKNMSLDFKLKHFLKGVYNPPIIRNQIWLGAFSQSEQASLFSREVNSQIIGFDSYDILKKDLYYTNYRDDYDLITHTYQKNYLSDDILFKVDRASMMNSLEVRAPFLDVDLVEYANSLPSNYKIKKTMRKYILKKALEGKLPNDILYRKKKGFGIPLTKWINEDLKKEISGILDYEKIKKEGIFNPIKVSGILTEHFKGKKDNRKQIWSLYVFEKWRENNLR